MELEWQRYTMRVTILGFFGGMYSNRSAFDLTNAILNYSELLGVIERAEVVKIYLIAEQLLANVSVSYVLFLSVKKELVEALKQIAPHPELKKLKK